MRKVLLIAVAAVLLAGCGSVHAYDRGRMAKPKMQLDLAPDERRLEEHVYEYREGSAGGYGAGGGGCGCN